MYSALKRRGNVHFHVVSTWNACGVFVNSFVLFLMPEIKKQNDHRVAGAYLELYQRCKMEYGGKKVNGQKPLTIFAKRSILYVYRVLNTLMGSTDAVS